MIDFVIRRKGGDPLTVVRIDVESDASEAVKLGAAMSVALAQGCDLADAVLSGVVPAGACDLTDARLSGADLSGASLEYAYAGGADLSRANLAGACLINANLSGANLAGADLSGADLSGANLVLANLTGARLSGARFGPMAMMASARFAGVDVAQLKLTRAQRQAIRT